MEQAKFERKDHMIQNLESGEIEHLESVNKAKQKSRSLQNRSGDGSVRVVEKFTELEELTDEK